MMPAKRSTRTTTVIRLTGAFIAAALVVSACGSADDGGSELAAGAQGTPTADHAAGQDNDGDQRTPTTPPVAAPDETPSAVPATPKPPTPTPTVPPTAEPTAVPTPGQSEPIPIEVPDLIGQDWFVRAVDSTRPDVLPRPNGAVAHIRFNADGTITGNAACNSFTADYSVDGADLSITNFAITEMNCFIPDWSAFVEFLPQTTGYGSAGGPDPILFVGSDTSISLGSTPPDPNQAPVDAASSIVDYIGLTEIEAAQLADTSGVEFRVSSIDGEPQALTLDFIHDRVNVDLVNGVVVAGVLG